MHKQSIDDELASVMDLAYFEGDFWPNVIEEQIKELDQEERAQASGEVSISSSILCHHLSIINDGLSCPSGVSNTVYSILLGQRV